MGEVKNIDINIVGMFSNSDEVSEIVDVAKVFIVEERMKDITFDKDGKKIILEKKVKSPKKLKLDSFSVDCSIPFMTVRGLN